MKVRPLCSAAYCPNYKCSHVLYIHLINIFEYDRYAVRCPFCSHWLMIDNGGLKIVVGAEQWDTIKHDESGATKIIKAELCAPS